MHSRSAVPPRHLVQRQSNRQVIAGAEQIRSEPAGIAAGSFSQSAAALVGSDRMDVISLFTNIVLTRRAKQWYYFMLALFGVRHELGANTTEKLLVASLSTDGQLHVLSDSKAARISKA